MLRSFDNLSGSQLENWFTELFRNALQLRYYPTSGQIELNALDPCHRRGLHLEIDGIILINRTCVFVEVTNQNREFRNKIRSFARNCNLFLTSDHLSSREKYQLFEVPDEDLDDFEDIENYRFLYIGTSNSFENENLTSADFPDFPQIQSGLKILTSTDIEYFRQLSGLINFYAQNELFAAIGLRPEDVSDE